jgi:hypothetical protein
MVRNLVADATTASAQPQPCLSTACFELQLIPPCGSVLLPCLLLLQAPWPAARPTRRTSSPS